MTIKDLKPTLIWQRFDDITKVPRPSKKEEKIRKFLTEFAASRNIEIRTDEIGNIVYLIPATKGYENAPVVILQGHMDMVCEKNNDTVHDFDNDPIKTIVEGEWLRADGTTLGADNGIGCAAAMALVDDKDAIHGPIEALFTVDEETGLTGACKLGKGMITGSMLVNLDSEDEAEIFLGCAGGTDTTATTKFEYVPAPKDYYYAKVMVTGLRGGHSGMDIDKGFANANKIMARYAWNLMQKFDVVVSEIEGGNLRNAIAREASITIGVPSSNKEDIVIEMNKLLAEVTGEFAKTEKPMLKAETVDKPESIIDTETITKIVQFLYCCPHGVLSMSQEIAGLVETSTNLASVKMNKETQEITIATSQRSAVESLKWSAAHQIEACFQLAGIKATHGDGYPGWAPNTESPILKIAVKAYEDLYGITPACKALHAGLECGMFLEHNPALDMISFGPTLCDVHSPKERIHIPAVDKFWNHLVRLLEMIAKG
ncbi:MAG: aminoacyl-histidine dipeptidase [Bacteroidales bacterium]